MILTFFKRNHPVVLIAIPITITLLWLKYFIQFSSLPADIGYQMPLYKGFAKLLVGNNLKFLTILISMLLLSLVAISLNRLVAEYNFPTRNTYLSALSFVTIATFCIPAVALHEALISAVFILLMLFRLFSIYKKQFAFKEVFEAGLFSGLASVFYFPAVVLFLVIWLGFVVLRRMNWREWVIALMGMLVPYMFVCTYLFWVDGLTQFYDQNILSSFRYFSSLSIKVESAAVWFTIPVIVLALIASLMTFSQTGKSAIQTRKNFYILGWMSLLSVFAILLSASGYLFGMIFLIIPVSVVIATYLGSVKKSWLANVIYLILLASSIGFQLANAS